jgi:large subunit ribosomal protein L25
METQTLKAEVRDGRGKGPARQLRAAGMIPAVFYGPAVETTALTVRPKELVKALSTKYGKNAVLVINVGGQDHQVMVKAIEVHPVSREPLHVDLYKVSDDRAVEVRVPISTTGRALGVQKGGAMTVVFRDVPVRTTPSKIPAVINIDVSKIDIGETVNVENLILPEGVEVLMKPDRRVVVVGETVKPVAGDEDEAAAPGAPAAAAPAT